MTGPESLAGEVTRAVGGDPWFGPSALAVLSGVDASIASASVPGASHSIWEIVLHMTVWADYVAYRLQGGVPRDPDESWPAAATVDGGAWVRTLDDLHRAHEAVAKALSAIDSRELDAVADSTPRDDFGDPVTLRRVVEGVAQHAAYHVGQIAVLKQLLGVAKSCA